MTRAAPAIRTPLLEIEKLRAHFFTRDGIVRAVDGVSLSVESGKTLGVVGESGCGKSVTALSILRLVQQPPGRILSGAIRFEGIDLLTLSESEMRRIRGNKISMIFQEPMTSLNPVLTVARQVGETVILHQGLDAGSAAERTVELLRLVKISEPERRAQQYPHEMSVGMRQRVMIAMEKADALYRSAVAGRRVTAQGDLETVMAGLSCGEVSLLAWEVLRLAADDFVAIADDYALDAVRLLASGRHGDAAIVAGETGVAGLAGLQAALADPAAKKVLGLGSLSRILLLGSEGATDADIWHRIAGHQPDQVAAI